MKCISAKTVETDNKAQVLKGFLHRKPNKIPRRGGGGIPAAALRANVR